ncbi:MAG: hypothetical protein L0Z53_19420 [Acidobacteriales bacterium]|nr:hypothetical protein [Terriglobales bacterium]
MLAVECPRCGRVWYSDEEDAGSKRLCVDCVRQLKERHGRPFQIDAFVIVTAVLIIVDVLFITLAVIWRGIVAKFLLGYGAVLLVGGLIGLLVVTPWWYRSPEEVDWRLARWPQMLALVGGACVLAAYFALR